jgi:general secretion pathway protein G
MRFYINIHLRSFRRALSEGLNSITRGQSPNRRISLRKGITLVELAIVLLVLGIIMGIVYANLDFGITDDAKRLAVKNSSHQLQMHWERYEFGNPPLEDGISLELLTQKNEQDPTFRPVNRDLVLDPWKRPYFICTDENSQRQICSYGADGIMGGEGQNADYMLTNEASWPEWLRGVKKE